jgi:hypothetical protein
MKRRDKMSERYLITGVQLGMLKLLKTEKERNKLIDEVLDKQFLGNSKKDIAEDTKSISTFFTGYYDDSESYKS